MHHTSHVTCHDDGPYQMLNDFAATATAIGATTKKLQKERILAGYLASLDDASLERAVVFFAGAPFPRRDQRVTGVGWSTIAEAFLLATGRTADELWEVYPRFADLGDTIAEVFPPVPERDLTLPELGELFERLAATAGSGEKMQLLADLFRRVGPEGARYVVKTLQSEVRIGLQEGLVESAIARAFDQPLVAVRRANMLSGDIGATALLARSGTLESVQMALFTPFAFMLAQPEEDPAKIVAALGGGAIADDKYDGIRAQIHSDGDEVRIFTRTLDDVTHRFPELADAASLLRRAFVVDGEIVAFSDRILPFAIIQKRLGRKKVSSALLRDAPVTFFAFDLVHLDGDTLFDRPLRERLEKLATLIPSGSQHLRASTQSPIRDAGHVDALFDEARARANEGLVVKDPESVYTPGRRGKAWLKYKKALATLDCVVTYAQYGNGKRRDVLSDLTFAVRREGELVNIGKAYTGLTDVEIASTTSLFKSTTIELHGPVHRVEPTLVLEIAFDRIQESKRHKAGYALRFPRIVRIRDDKNVDEISTIDEVRRIYEGQLKREQGNGPPKE